MAKNCCYNNFKKSDHGSWTKEKVVFRGPISWSMVYIGHAYMPKTQDSWWLWVPMLPQEVDIYAVATCHY